MLTSLNCHRPNCIWCERWRERVNVVKKAETDLWDMYNGLVKMYSMETVNTRPARGRACNNAVLLEWLLFIGIPSYETLVALPLPLHRLPIISFFQFISESDKIGQALLCSCLWSSTECRKTSNRSPCSLFLITARCYRERGIAMASCLSVRLSVTLRYRDHIGWNSWKIISRLISLTFSLSACRIYSKGNPQILAGIREG